MTEPDPDAVTLPRADLDILLAVETLMRTF